MKKLILIGAGGHCISVIDVIETSKEYSIEGILDIKEKIGECVLGHKVIGDDSIIEELSLDHHFLITIGHLGNPTLRKKIIANLDSNNAKLATVISANAYISPSAKIEHGSVIHHGSIVNANAQIGKHCIINTAAIIEHDVTIGDNNHISTSSVINGGCSIGDNTFIGSKSVIIQAVNICNNVCLGAGSVVVKDINIEGTYFGIPAKQRGSQ
jgi:sugar O-acyltransferase (sialic acid O-acetyltransferase NeuD family)